MGAVVRASRLLGPALLLAGVAALAVGFAQGEASFSLFVIFPVITATGAWSALGIVLLIAGFFSIFLTWTSGMPAERPPPTGPAPGPTLPASAPPAQRRWGGVVFLGPVPVVFGSDAKIARWMIVVGVLLFIGLVVLTLLSIRCV